MNEYEEVNLTLNTTESMYKVKRKRCTGTQVGFDVETKDSGTQTECCEEESYNREERQKKRVFTTYDYLKSNVLCSKESLLKWLKEEGLIANVRNCVKCGESMKWVKCCDRKDGFKWVCHGRSGLKRCGELSIRKDSWFEASNMTLHEIIKFIYWWCSGLEQWQIREQMCLASNTVVDWENFCREICKVVIMKESCKLGGPGKVVQIDESKIGKRKYHRGHRVDGQWVFGGIEEGSRKCLIVAVETQAEKELLPIIKEWIEPGTLIISDCWKSYNNLTKNGYEHACVNHSKEFVNSDGKPTNKIEGHWRHMKASLPKFGVRKNMYSGYLVEFMWRYVHKEDDKFEAFLRDITKVYKL